MFVNNWFSITLSHFLSYDMCNQWNWHKQYWFCVRLRFSRRWLWRMVSSGMLRRVALVRTDVSEEPSASFIRVTRIGELWTTLAATRNRLRVARATRRNIPEDTILHYWFWFVFVLKIWTCARAPAVVTEAFHSFTQSFNNVTEWYLKLAHS
jgi:hypothetical protein